MFPLTHIWLIGQILNRGDTALDLGSIFPDAVLGAPLTHTDTHFPGNRLWQYLTAGPLDLRRFATGFASHTADPQGLDYFSDEYYDGKEQGYAFQHGTSITEQVIACGVPGKLAYWKSHNFIEMGMELHVHQLDPAVSERALAALGDKTLLQQVIPALAGYWHAPVTNIRRNIEMFPEFLCLTDPTPQRLAAIYDRQMFAKHGLHLDINATAATINLAADLIIPTWQEFLACCQRNVSDVLAGLTLNS